MRLIGQSLPIFGRGAGRTKRGCASFKLPKRRPCRAEVAIRRPRAQMGAFRPSGPVRRSSMKPQLAVLYEHPKWFEPLFAALERRGVSFEAIRLSDHSFDPTSNDIPAPVVLSRVAMSSFLRQADHGIFYAESLLAHWASRGARVLNGAEVIAIDSSKARQLSLISSLSYAVPATRVVHRSDELVVA